MSSLTLVYISIISVSGQAGTNTTTWINDYPEFDLHDTTVVKSADEMKSAAQSVENKDKIENMMKIPDELCNVVLNDTSEFKSLNQVYKETEALVNVTTLTWGDCSDDIDNWSNPLIEAGQPAAEDKKYTVLEPFQCAWRGMAKAIGGPGIWEGGEPFQLIDYTCPNTAECLCDKNNLNTTKRTCLNKILDSVNQIYEEIQENKAFVTNAVSKCEAWSKMKQEDKNLSDNINRWATELAVNSGNCILKLDGNGRELKETLLDLTCTTWNHYTGNGGTKDQLFDQIFYNVEMACNVIKQPLDKHHKDLKDALDTFYSLTWKHGGHQEESMSEWSVYQVWKSMDSLIEIDNQEWENDFNKFFNSDTLNQCKESEDLFSVDDKIANYMNALGVWPKANNGSGEPCNNVGCAIAQVNEAFCPAPGPTPSPAPALRFLEHKEDERAQVHA